MKNKHWYPEQLHLCRRIEQQKGERVSRGEISVLQDYFSINIFATKY